MAGGHGLLFQGCYSFIFKVVVLFSTIASCGGCQMNGWGMVWGTATGGPGMLGGPRLPGGTGVAGGLRPQGGQFAPGGSRGFVGLRAPGAQRQANPRHPAAQPVHNMLHGAQQYHGGQRLPCPVQPAKLGLPVGQGPQQFPGSQGQERQARGPSLPRADNTSLAAKSQIPVWDNFPNGFITKN